MADLAYWQDMCLKAALLSVCQIKHSIASFFAMRFVINLIRWLMCEGIRRLLIKRNEKVSLRTVFATFSFMGTIASRQKM